MTSPRRPRNTLVAPTALGYQVELESKQRFDALARIAGVSKAEFFERVVANIPVDESGLPTWWPESIDLLDGELPIESA